MYCPKCKKSLHCGCNSCIKKNPDRPGNMIWDKTGELESCPYCGFKEHADYWFDWQFYDLDEEGNFFKIKLT